MSKARDIADRKLDGTDLTFGDNDKAIFGAGSDLQIYHDGSNSRIKDTGTGALVLQTNQVNILSTTGEQVALFNEDSNVKLYYNNAIKLATTSTGIDVTGTATMDGLTIGSSGNITGGSVMRIHSTEGSRGSVQISAPNESTNREVSYGNNLYLTDADTYAQDSSGIGGSALLMSASNNGYGKFKFMSKQDPDAGGAIAERMCIDGDGNVGIGTSSPTGKLHVNSSAGANFLIGANGTSTNYLDANTNIFRTGSFVETMRIDANGNLLVGKTATTEADVGHTLGTSGYGYATADGGICYSFNRKTSDGDILRFRKDLTTVGSIGTTNGLGVRHPYFINPNYGGITTGNASLLPATSTGAPDSNNTKDLGASGFKWKDLYLSGDVRQGQTTIKQGTYGIDINNTGTYLGIHQGSDAVSIMGSMYTSVPRIDPATDNYYDLAEAASRFKAVYAVTGTIQTSDINEKQDIEELSEAELRVAVKAKSLLRKFRWKDAVAEKGDAARIHVGIMSQQLRDAFAEEGLDAHRYGMFTSDTWWETSEEAFAIDAVEATYDEEGNLLTEAVPASQPYTKVETYPTQEEAPEGAVEKTRLGIRYDQLLAFIIAAI